MYTYVYVGKVQMQKGDPMYQNENEKKKKNYRKLYVVVKQT